MRGKMDCSGLTDVGRKRPVNEDQFLIADLNKSMLIHQTSLSHEDHTRVFGGSQGKLLLVADGMGGHAEGKRASALAVQSLTHYVLNTLSWFFRLHPDHEEEFREELKAALEECQQHIEAATRAGDERPAMGTTLTMAYVLWPRLYVVHAGDSRCYLLRGERLEQVTTDHTMAQRLVESGALRPEEAQESRWSHLLWNCIGGGRHELTADVYRVTLHVGDSLLLCTDGLTQVASDEQILQLLRQKRLAEETCRELVEAANEAGGPDNVTVVVAHFRDAQELPFHVRHQAAVAEPLQELEVKPPPLPASEVAAAAG
jgi:serine/threonine protein phosphatase PrpC